MQYTGLMRKYGVDRALTDQERERQLKQKERLEVEPAYQLSVIRLNSTYMELVDKFFAWKGFSTTFVIIAAIISLSLPIGMFFISLETPGRLGRDWPFVLLMGAIVAPLLWFLSWGFLKEAFAWTHYPIRLNRKTRIVHAFRTDGTVLSVPWDEVFFCIASLPKFNYEVQGHVLDADGVTVRATFPLTFHTVKSDMSSLSRFWEFVRRYMEEDPRETARRVEIFLDIADKKETLRNGFRLMHADSGINVVTYVIGGLMALVILPGRWLAMRTSKLPVWPEEIEAQCRIEPNDPYVRDARDNPPDLR